MNKKMKMRLTFPTVQKKEKNKKDRLITKFIEILYHTIAPVVCTYYMIKYDQIIFLIPIILIMIIRIDLREE